MNLSAKTSINKNKVPYLFTHNHWITCGNNLDIGGGKYDTATIYMKEKYNIINIIYGTYNRSEEHNKKALNDIYTTRTISNVLNVILDKSERKKVLELAKSKATSYIYITVYEGNQTSISSKTQTNMKLQEYITEIIEIFPNNEITIKNRIIAIKI